MSTVLRPVDRAALAAALGDRLRRRGVPVTLSSLATFTQALAATPPDGVESLYWSARVTLANRYDDLAIFDAVFDAVFRDSEMP
ncbi:MAG: hypothetical protein ABI083_01190, partial [Lapillicoccus sp.]